MCDFNIYSIFFDLISCTINTKLKKLAPNGLNEMPNQQQKQQQLDMNAINNNKNNINTKDDTSVDDTSVSSMSSDYEPGHATEMLTNSVLNLKIESDTKENFKAHAGKILTGMLESRLNNERKNSLQNGKAQSKILTTLAKSMQSNEQSNKHNSHDTNGNAITNGKPAFRSLNAIVSVASPPPPPPMPPAAGLPQHSPIAKFDTKVVAMPLKIPTSPPLAPLQLQSLTAVDFPPPPSPSELKNEFPSGGENHSNHLSCRRRRSSSSSSHSHSQSPSPTSIIGKQIQNPIQKLTDSEHDTDNEQTYSPSVIPIDGFSANRSSSGSHSLHHHQQQQQHHQYANGNTNNVVFRNKNVKPELTTHARDRRSYVGKGPLNPNRYPNNNNNLITSYTTEYVDGLRDGKRPVCSVCHVAIPR